jgi:hypothetical protein
MATTTTTRPAFPLVIKHDFGWNLIPLEKLESQVKTLNEMFFTLKRMKKDIENPTAKILVDRMHEIFDENVNDVLEEFVNRLEGLQSLAIQFEQLENEAWEIEEV